MSASIDPIRALVDHLNSRGNINYDDIVGLLDALIEQKLAEYVCDLRQRDLSPHEIEASIEAQSELAHKWKSDVLYDVTHTFFRPTNT